MITTDRITKTYKRGLRGRQLTALADFSLTVPAGRVFGLIGPNGAGKSSLLKILMGFLRADRGQVLINGIPPQAAASRCTLGYLPEHPCLYDQLTIKEHLQFVLQTHNTPAHERREKIAALLHKVDLAHAADTKIRQCSKGMVQRAALACALITDPSLLIFDEPMSGLDPLGRKLVVEIIQELRRQEATVLFSSHILTDVERMCDRIGIINKGHLLAVTSPRELAEMELPPSELQAATPLESFFFTSIAPAAASGKTMGASA